MDRQLMAGDLTNGSNPFDVNADNAITASDALAVINYLSRSSINAEGESAPSLMYMDVNGDDQVTTGDALMVINELSRQTIASLPANTDEIVTASNETGSHSGHVGVKVRGRDVFVDFTGTDDTLVIWTPQPGMLRLEHGTEYSHDVPIGDDLFIEIAGSDLTVLLGKTFEMVVEPPAESEYVDTDAPYDESYLEIIGATVPDDLFVHLRGDANAFVMRASQVGDDLIFTGSNGRDRVEIGSGSIIADLASIVTLSGDDHVLLGGGNRIGTIGINGIEQRGARVGGDFIADLGNGNDVMEFDFAEIGDDGTVVAGNGDDQILHEQLRVRDDFFVHGLNGNDFVRARNVEVGDDAHLWLGNGNDTAEVSFVRVGDVGEIHGGNDYDVLRSDDGTIDVKHLKIRKFEEVRPLSSLDD